MSEVIRNRYDSEKMKQIVFNFEKSGLSQKDFCKEQSIPLSVFYYWRKKLLSTDSSTQAGFRQIKSPEHVFEVELTYPNGVRLSSSQGFDVLTLHTLIKLW